MLEEERRKNATVKDELSQMRRHATENIGATAEAVHQVAETKESSGESIRLCVLLDLRTLPSAPLPPTLVNVRFKLPSDPSLLSGEETVVVKQKVNHEKKEPHVYLYLYD